MAIEVRRLKNDGEFEQYLEASIYAFNSARDGSQMERYRKLYEPEWCLGAFDGERLVAGMTVVPFEQHMLGNRIPLGGVATVASLPERRREGFVGALLRGGLREMREAGQPLSGLYTPHFSLYRRFGWEIANRVMSYSFAPKVIQSRLPRPGGSFRRIGVEAWDELAGLRESFVARRNGALHRTEQRWRAHVFSDYFKGSHDAVVWSNEQGDVRGYAVYTQQHRQSGGPWGQTVLRVFDFVALDGQAYAALLGYLTSHDLADQVVLVVSEDEPLMAALEEPTHLKEPPGLWTGMLLRVVDIEQAFAARPAHPQASGLSVTFRVRDTAAAWNTDTWRLSSSEGRMSAERTKGVAQLELDAVALGPLFNGFSRPRESARVGQLDVRDENALDRLTRLLAVDFAPHCPDDF